MGSFGWWILRVVIAILIFIVVWLGVPWVLGFFGGPQPPDNLMKAIAALVALLWFFGDYRYGWTRRVGPGPGG